VLAFLISKAYNFRTLAAVLMSIFASRLGFALVVAALSLGARTAHAQAAAVPYASWPLGFAGNLAAGQSANVYGNVAGFDGNDARGGFSVTHTNFPSSWLAGGMSLGMTGISQAGAFGNSLSYDGVQFGYKFENGLPLKVYAGFDTLKYNTGIGGPFAPFDTTSGTLPGYRAHAGVEFQPAPNVSLSLGVGYTQQPGRVDSDINSLALGGRR
jgi:opacity protein-like surface antigen